ncbi:MAG: uncharacterized protein A8A55_1520 [Amphiamblys sp. WSBS2006]|nr:MAG: uncharacterized protein A8A55_1520 [Amphiamblys sp. WSBS2006]
MEEYRILLGLLPKDLDELKQTAIIDVASRLLPAAISEEIKKYTTKIADPETSDARAKQAGEELEICRIALAVKRKFLSLGPYKQSIGIAPHEAATKVPELKKLLGYTTKGFRPYVPKKNPVTVEEAKQIFLALQRSLDRLANRPGPKRERELQLPFYRFMASFFTEEHDVRCFVDVGGYETDLLLQKLDSDDCSFIEIKKDCVKNDDFVSAILQVALYPMKQCMMKGEEGVYVRNLAVVSLPELKTKLATATIRLGIGGVFKSCSLNADRVVSWMKKDENNPLVSVINGEEICRFLNHIGKCIVRLEEFSE